jgi:hypothetical protein
MVSKKTPGKKPIQRMATTKGRKSQNSRRDRSAAEARYMGFRLPKTTRL